MQLTKITEFLPQAFDKPFILRIIRNCRSSFEVEIIEEHQRREGQSMINGAKAVGIDGIVYTDHNQSVSKMKQRGIPVEPYQT